MAADATGVTTRRPSTTVDARPPRARRVRRPRWIGLLYIAPAAAIYLLFVIAPAFHTVWLSLYNWNGVTVGTWAGLDNYRAVGHNPLLRDAVVHAFVLVVFFSFLPIVTGMLLAAILGRFRRRGMTGFRIVYFL